MKRYATHNGSSFVRYGIKGHTVFLGRNYRGGIRL